MNKRELKVLVSHAYDMKKKTFGTEVVFNIYSNSHYILDTEEDNVIEQVLLEENAITLCNDLNSLNKDSVYYKPILVDEDTFERITRGNFKLYDLNSEYVKKLIKELNS